MDAADNETEIEAALRWALDIVEQHGTGRWKPDDPNWTTYKECRNLLDSQS